jgi:type II secretory pathway pseudopilin PulG
VSWRSRVRDESGISLLELVVVTSLLSVILGFVLPTFTSIQRADVGNALRLENLAEARILMATVSRDIRTAARISATSSPFVLADDRELTFYANLNLSTSCPKRIRLYIDASDRLVEQVTAPDAGGSPPNCAYSGSPTVRLVGRYIANTPSQPVFTLYRDVAGTPTAFSTADTPLSAANLLLVDAVGIRFSIRKSTTYVVAPTTVMNKVRLPNVDYNPLASPSPSP